MNFDMNAAWSRGIELVQSNFQLLLVIAGVFILLPTVAIYLLLPNMQLFLDPTADPEVLAQQMQAVMGPFIGGALFATLFQFAGYGAMLALMGEDRPTVGQALGAGIKAVPSLIAILIMFAIVYVIGAVLIMLPISLLVGVAGAPALGLIAIVPVLIFILWMMARLSMSMPVLVLGGTLNPVTAMTRSFAMTKPRQWAILGFWAVIFVVFTVISLLFNGVVGLIAAIAGTGTVAMLIVGLANGLTSMIFGMLICGIAVAIFVQLSGPGKDSIEDTFG